MLGLLPQDLRFSKQLHKAKYKACEHLLQRVATTLHQSEHPGTTRLFETAKLAVLSGAANAFLASPVPARDAMLAAGGAGLVSDLAFPPAWLFKASVHSPWLPYTTTFLAGQWHANVSIGCGASPKDIEPRAHSSDMMSFLLRYGIVGIPERGLIWVANVCGQYRWMGTRRLFVMLAMAYRLPLEAARAATFAATLLMQCEQAVAFAVIAVVVSVFRFVFRPNAQPHELVPCLHRAKALLAHERAAERWRDRWHRVAPADVDPREARQQAQAFADIVCKQLQCAITVARSDNAQQAREHIVFGCQQHRLRDGQWFVPRIFCQQVEAIQYQLNDLSSRYARAMPHALDQEIVRLLFRRLKQASMPEIWEAQPYRQMSRRLHPDKLTPHGFTLSPTQREVAQAMFGLFQSVRTLHANAC